MAVQSVSWRGLLACWRQHPAQQNISVAGAGVAGNNLRRLAGHSAHRRGAGGGSQLAAGVWRLAAAWLAQLMAACWLWRAAPFSGGIVSGGWPGGAGG